MALSRIRQTNSEFADATLTGAQIRVRSGASINPAFLNSSIAQMQAGGGMNSDRILTADTNVPH